MTVSNIGARGAASRSTPSAADDSRRNSDNVQDAVSTIKSKLSESWRDWDVSSDDLRGINRTLDDLNPQETNETIAALPDDTLEKWADEIDGTIGGLSADERKDLFSNLASDLNSTQLARVYEKLADAHKPEFTDAVNNNSLSSTRIEFVENAQRSALSSIDTEGLTPEQKELMLDLGQLALDIVGLADPTPISDGVNGVVSLFRGDFLGAGISAVSMIPYIGDAAKLGKLGKWSETVVSVAEMAAKNADFAKVAEPILKKIDDAIDAIPNDVLDNLPASARETLQKIQTKVDDVLGVGNRLSGFVDEFAALERKDFRSWKSGLAEQGLSSTDISEVIYQGSLKRGENMWGDNWKKYYEEISGTTYPGQPSHAHHLVEKVGRGEFSATNREILREVGIDPLLARENLTWAPNVAGQHGTGPQRELMELLQPVRGDRDAIVQVLKDWAEIAKAR